MTPHTGGHLRLPLTLRLAEGPIRAAVAWFVPGDDAAAGEDVTHRTPAQEPFDAVGQQDECRQSHAHPDQPWRPPLRAILG